MRHAVLGAVLGDEPGVTRGVATPIIRLQIARDNLAHVRVHAPAPCLEYYEAGFRNSPNGTTSRMAKIADPQKLFKRRALYIHLCYTSSGIRAIRNTRQGRSCPTKSPECSPHRNVPILVGAKIRLFFSRPHKTQAICAMAQPGCDISVGI